MESRGGRRDNSRPRKSEKVRKNILDDDLFGKTITADVIKRGSGNN